MEKLERAEGNVEQEKVMYGNGSGRGLWQEYCHITFLLHSRLLTAQKRDRFWY